MFRFTTENTDNRYTDEQLLVLNEAYANLYYFFRYKFHTRRVHKSTIEEHSQQLVLEFYRKGDSWIKLCNRIHDEKVGAH